VSSENPPDDNKPISIPQDLIKDIPEEKREEFIRQYFLHIEQYLSPIPSPRIMGSYEQILPGSADRILAMAEQQQESEIEMEKQRHNHRMQRIKLVERGLEASIQHEKLGMWLGFGLALVMMASGTLVILSGFTEGFGLVTAPAIAIAVVYLKELRSSNEQTKSETLEKPASPPELPDG